MIKCHICNKEIVIITGTIDKIKYIDGKPTCHDCYFEKLGEMMEKYPPGFGFKPL
jgi:hypothetical protein